MTALFVVPLRATVSVRVPFVSLMEFVATLKLRMAESFVRIVTTTLLAPSVQLVTLSRRTLKVSLSSATRSFSTVTAKVLVVTPGAKLRTPLVARKSPAAAVAVPLVVAKFTVAAVFVAPVRTTVRVMLFVFSATLMVAKVKATDEASSSVIVTVLVAVPRVVLVALLRRSWNVSVLSWLRLSVMSMASVLVVTPGAKVNVPFVAP